MGGIKLNGNTPAYACQRPLRIGGPTATGRTTYSAIFTFRLVVSRGGRPGGYKHFAERVPLCAPYGYSPGKRLEYGYKT